jgi:hypothetical protein
MEKELLKLNILSIAVAGLLMLLTGLVLYLFKESLSNNIRFFLPIPPIGVAAYVFAFNMFRYYSGSLPGNTRDIFLEVIYSTAISTVVFFAFTALIIVITYLLKELL